MTISCWGFDVAEKEFFSAGADYRLKVETDLKTFYKKCPDWHSDMTEEELVDYITSKGIKIYKKEEENT